MSLPADFIRFHGRRKGKAIAPLKQRLYDEYFPELGFKDVSFFTGHKSCLEIGFGGGEHLAAMALAQPDVRFLGAEPFLNGVANLVYHLCHQKEPPQNIKIFPDDIRQLFRKFPDGLFDEVYLLFPDPWRKNRHTERRFVNEENILEMWRILKPGGTLIIASDDPTYIEWTDLVMPQYGDKLALAERVTTAPAGWIQTRYEAKALKAGRVPVYYRFIKI